MSTNYTCNQFEKAYIPTRLGNWEVPKWHLNRPKGRSTVTKVIANDRGHLLPGVQKTDQKHWAGLYLGTYQLPKRISKEIAIELTNPKCQTWMKRSYHHPFIDRSQQNKNNQLENTDSKEQPITNEEIDRDSIKSIKSAISYVPAADVSTTVPVRDCASADGRMKSTDDDGKQRVGRIENAKTPSSPALSRISAGDGNDDQIRETAENPRPTPPGRRHGDAQKHHRLPDAIEDAVYRSLQMKRNKHPAGLGLNGCWPKCSAVAYKSFNDPGPTQCSKLRIYRPKTSASSSSLTDAAAAEAGDGEKKEPMRRRGGKNPQRPQTCVPVVTAQQLTDIKLALCWDLDAPLDRNRPPRPPDEPAVFHKVQRPGGEGTGKPQPQPQNSSAVMGFVKTAAAENRDDDVVPEAQRTQTRECLMKNRNLSAVMELIPNKDGDRRGTETAATGRNDDVTAAVDRPLSNKPRSSSSSSLVRRSNDSSDGNDRDDNKSNDERSDDKLANDDNDDDVLNGARLRRRSSADISSCHQRRHQEAAVKKETTNRQRHVCRPCLACDNPNAVAAAVNKKADYDAERNHYKMAFKAGVPVSTPVKNRTAAAGKPARLLKVPKPKTTNSDKKKYVIGTLLPPFSMWPGTTARDYPEHWRLTSVYRQAFKPLELRKQSLLQTVYL